MASTEHQTIRVSGGSCQMNQDEVRVSHLRWRCWGHLYVFDRRRQTVSTRLRFLGIPLSKREVPFSQIAYLGLHGEVEFYGIFGRFPKFSVVMVLTGHKRRLEVAKVFYGRSIGRVRPSEEAKKQAETIEEAIREVTGITRYFDR